MKAYLYGLICIFCLSGCVNDVGIDTQSKPYNAKTLAVKHTYRIPTKTLRVARTSWWLRFDDPQLNQLMTVALADAPDLKMAINRLQRAQHLAELAGSARWPTIDFSGYVEKVHFPEQGIIPPPFNNRTFNIGDAGFNFNYEFDFWGKNREKFAARLSEQQVQEAELAEARLMLTTAIANTYLQLQYNIAQYKLALVLYKQRQELLDIIADRAKHGIDSDIPVKTAVTDAENAKLAIAEFKQLELLNRHQLAILLGKNPFTTRVNVEEFTYRSRDVDLPKLIPAHLLLQRPDIAAACANAVAAAHEINVAKAAFFPDINLNLLFSYQSINLSKLFDPSNQYNAIAPAFDLPIFDAGARRANLRIRDAEYDLAVNQYNQTLLNALRDVADQVVKLRTIRSQVAAQNQAYQASKQNLKLAQLRYRHGIVDYARVISSRAIMLQQQIAQVEYQSKQRLAVIAMIKAMGGDYQETGRSQ